jgi:hypothetical protein
MDAAFNAELWKDFYVMLGGSLAALTGLLFVATSLHLDEVGKRPHFRVRAFGNTFSLVGHLINAGLVLAPLRVRLQMEGGARTCALQSGHRQQAPPDATSSPARSRTCHGDQVAARAIVMQAAQDPTPGAVRDHSYHPETPCRRGSSRLG